MSWEEDKTVREAEIIDVLPPKRRFSFSLPVAITTITLFVLFILGGLLLVGILWVVGLIEITYIVFGALAGHPWFPIGLWGKASLFLFLFSLIWVGVHKVLRR